MLKNRVVKTFVKEERIYIDIEITNPLDAGIDGVDVVFDQSYNQDILKFSDRYKLTIARLGIPGSELPLFLADDNLYSVTISFGGTNFQQFLTFPGIELVRSINTFLTSLNTALQLAFEAYKVANAAEAQDFAPFVTFNNATKQLEVFVDENFNELFNGGVVPLVFYNNALLHLIGCTEFDVINQPELSDGRAGQWAVDDLGYNRSVFNFPLDDAGVQTARQNPPIDLALTLFQTQGNCLNSISQLTGFTIISNSFGNRSQIQNNTSLITSTDFNDADYTESNIVFDLLVDEAGSSLTEVFNYTPSLYRWIDILSHQHLHRIQFSIFYRLNDGNTYPLQIGLGRTVSVKFLLQSADELENHSLRGIDNNNIAEHF